MSFKDMLKKAKENAKNKENERIQKMVELDKQGVVYCSKCLSTNISTNKKGYGLGKGAAGAIVAGPLGLVVGMAGKNKVECTCLKCGHKFKASSRI